MKNLLIILFLLCSTKCYSQNLFGIPIPSNITQSVSTVKQSKNKTSYSTGFIWKATWYGIGDGCSHTTASGHKFNPYDPHIAAHRTLPFGTKLLLTNIHNGSTLQVTILDRGPFRKGVNLDLTYAGHKALGFDGVGELKVQVL